MVKKEDFNAYFGRQLKQNAYMIEHLSDYMSVATRPQTVWSLCISVIPGSVMLTCTVVEGFITE